MFFKKKSRQAVVVVTVFCLMIGSYKPASAAPSLQEDDPVPTVFDSAELGVALPTEAQQKQLSLTGDFIPGEYILALEVKQGKVSVSAQEVYSLAAEYGARVQSASITGDTYLLSYKDPRQGEQALAVLRAQPGVLWVEQNQRVTLPDPPKSISGDKLHAQAITSSEYTPQTVTSSADQSQVVYADSNSALWLPDDPYRPDQWYWSQMQFFPAQVPTTGSPCVVVLDSGVDYTHPELDGKVYPGYDFIDMDDDPMDENGHGTHVAGIIAAESNNGQGITGISPGSKILAIRVLDETGTGSVWSVSEGIKYANQSTGAACGWQAPAIYNLSLGSGYSYAVAVAVATANAMGRLVVASSGNENTSVEHYPAALEPVLAVAATDQNDYRTFFSNFDTAAAPWVDIAAPGYDILSTFPGDTYAVYSGTSQAAPIVSGLAAVVWAANPGFSADQVKARILTTGDPASGFPRSIPRVNATRALGDEMRVLQGRILDAYGAAPISGAHVTVKRFANGELICDLYTSSSGYYTCANLPAIGKYGVSVEKEGMVRNQQAYYIGARRFHADLTLTAENGGAGDYNWMATLQWPAWQPMDNGGLDLDLWAINRDTGEVYNASTFLYRQSERVEVNAADTGVFTLYAVNWDSGYSGDYPPYEPQSHITGSGAQVRIYRNNYMQRFINVPCLPLEEEADHWYIININTINNRYLFVNQVVGDSDLPETIYFE